MANRKAGVWAGIEIPIVMNEQQGEGAGHHDSRDERARLEALLKAQQDLIAQGAQKCRELDALWAARKDAVAKGRQPHDRDSQLARTAHVLIVDDEPAVRVLVEALLALLGYSSQTAASGTEALRLVVETRFDFVMTDLHLPGMSGLQLAEEIKSRKHGVPIMLITGNQAPENSPVIDVILLKPFTKDQLRDAIAKLLSCGARGLL